MTWRTTLYLKVKQYIKRDINDVYVNIFMGWWAKFSPEILNEVNELMDHSYEEGRQHALEDLKMSITQDGNIDKEDANVQRVLFLIQVFDEESQLRVDYTNPAEEDLPNDEDQAASDRIKEAVDR